MITYIIIDDETASHDIIEDYSGNLPYLSLQKHCYNAFEAIEYLNHHQVDLVFLDINMPKLTGFDFLKTLSNPPKIIVTTAYKEFALEGYELNIDDYLLKPFSFQRFVTAIQKVQGILSLHSQNVSNIDDSSIFLKDNKKHYQVKLKDLLFLEAYGNYVKVYLEHQMIITHQTLSSFEGMLSKKDFIKVHKSFIIAKTKIELIEGNRITIKDHKIPVGKMYRPNINDLLS
ncbi:MULTISPECIES: LytR/AlgR family response regulator transcription factor [Aquimarina]|uniref:LytR/AlgR family response regulator transcription factor n=1 Tax=Aquimarina TaxID=290174 RepID=UPI000941F3BA|nr:MULTISPECIES: response regulator transcription factor [Aquimarina]